MLASFEEEIDKAFSLMAERSELYQTVESTVRRASVRKLPFSVFYRILPEWIEVIAVVHQSRDMAATSLSAECENQEDV